MKKYLIAPLLALAAPVAAQSTEIIGRVGLGLMQFGGPDAVSTSHINYSNYSGTSSGYTNSPYGSQLGAGYSLGARFQQVASWNGLLAFDIGYDWLHARTRIVTVDYYDGHSNTARPATGTTLLESKHLAAFLGLGYRFKTPVVDIDLLAGPEMAYVFGFHENGSGTYDGNQAWATSADRSALLWGDARLRADATIWYHRVGVNTSYSHGFINYQSGLVGATREVYARILRLGLAYRLQ